MTLLTNRTESDDPTIEAARQALRTGEVDRAEALARACLDTDPASVGALNLLGAIAIRRKRPAEAVRLYTAATEQDKGPTSALNLAQALELAGDRTGAAAAYRVLLDRFPDHPAARARLVKVLFAAGDADGVAGAVSGLSAGGIAVLDAEASFLAAMSLLQRGDEHRAGAFLDRTLAVDPAHTGARRLLGGRMMAQGRHADVIGVLTPLLEREPANAEVHMQLARAHEALGNRQDAVRHFRQAAEDPAFAPEAGRAAGSILHAQGDHVGAADLLGAAHRADPANVSLAERLITSLLALKRPAHIVAVARAVLDTGPADIAVWNNMAVHIKAAGDKDLAVRYLRAALLRDPTNTSLLYNAGHTLNEMSHAEEGERHLRRAVRIDPGYAKAWNALCVSLSIQFRLDEAEAAVRTALRLNDASKSAWLNLAIVLRGQGLFSESIDCFRKALAIDPRYIEANHNLALTLLMVGEIREGFQLYDWRFALPDFPSPKRAFPQREWTGQDLSTAGLVVYMEQGMGDEVMFSWYLHHLSGRARRLVVDCDPRLIPLFARSFPAIEFVPRSLRPDSRALAPDIRYKLPAGHLPKFFWVETREQINRTCHLAGRPYVRTDGYLRVDPERLAHWRAWLAERAGGRPLVGISWRSALHTRTRDMQYLAPDEIARVFGDGVAVVNLQYSTADEELDAFAGLSARHGFRFIHPEGIDLKNDLDDVMALTAALDLVVTPLISVAWMAGALGVPTWVFRTSEVSRIWQQFGMPYIPWCPSMRLFFRHPLAPWEQTLTTVRGELDAWLATR
ncbi:tetratricopeptide repeat protein [Azospirillum halopraeferens]|uniref:tetratricopeptide repeat protein n=1 Tax=Azospirillum halopraeferens TaxID=34010 RepID=UPI0004068F00|nr:tetratricopeptide repeat protein [Azospirillum halopraeferens]